VKIFDVASTSTSSPRYMKAVKSETRAACCMLCVTMSTVTRWRSSVISSSIFAVAMGSSADVGSSNSRISGSVASARAMHRRCIWPPESASAESFMRSFTSSQIAAPRSAFSTRSASSVRLLTPRSRNP